MQLQKGKKKEGHTKTNPFTKDLSIRNLDQGDLVLRAKSDNELLVSLLLAGLVEDTHVRLATVEGLGGLAETTGKTVVDQGDLENALERIVDGHLAAAGLGGDLDILGLGDGGVGNGLFSVRLCKNQMLDIVFSWRYSSNKVCGSLAYHCDGVIWWVVD